MLPASSYVANIVLDEAARQRRAKRLLERLEEDHVGVLTDIASLPETKELMREDDGESGMPRVLKLGMKIYCDKGGAAGTAEIDSSILTRSTT